MSNSRFTNRDAVVLFALLAILSAMTVVLWLLLHFFTPLNLSVSDVYVGSCVLLLVIHLIRLRVRARRAARPKQKGPRIP